MSEVRDLRVLKKELEFCISREMAWHEETVAPLRMLLSIKLGQFSLVKFLLSPNPAPSKGVGNGTIDAVTEELIAGVSDVDDLLTGTAGGLDVLVYKKLP